MATWMYAIREFEDGVDDCQTCEDIVRGCNDNSADASINAWDEGVAFAIGSLEGTQGNSRKVGTNRRILQELKYRIYLQRLICQDCLTNN